jgi:hypothetical protein
VERGVRVQVSAGGWDHHGNLQTALASTAGSWTVRRAFVISSGAAC